MAEKTCRKCGALFSGPYCKACKSAYAQTNKERIAVRQAEWKKANAAKLKAYFAEYQVENQQRISARTRARHEANLEQSRADARRRRRERLERESGGALSKGLVQRLMVLQQSKCACCRCDLRVAGHHTDHVEPLALGGRHSDENIQLLCPTCNHQKNLKPAHVFMQEKGYLL